MADRQHSRAGDEALVVRDPDLTPRANEILTDELREASRSGTAPGRAVAAAGAPRDAPGRAGLSRVSSARYLAALIAALTVVALGLTVGLVGGAAAWVVLPLAVMVVALVVLGRWALSSLRDVDAPSPEHRAALEEEGIADPDHELNVRLRRLADASDEHVDGPVRDVDRRTPADREGATAAAEQQDAWTPGSGRSTRLGA